MAKVILFARVSSTQQDFERQKSDLKELIINDGLMEDDNFDYIQIGRRTELWHIVGNDLRENWTGTWDADRILDAQKRRRRGAKN